MDMHTYPLDKPGYFLFQDSSSRIWNEDQYEQNGEF